MSAAEFAERHDMPPPERWVDWVAEVIDFQAADWRLDLQRRYVELLDR
jgi:hypothetical protein